MNEHGRLRRAWAELRNQLGYWGAPRTWPRVTAGLLLLNTAVFLVLRMVWGIDLWTLHRFGAYDATAVWRGEVWRLVTPMLLHAGWLHLLLNQLALLLFCGEIERSLGSWPYLMIYLCSGVIASAASGVVPPEAISVGASGAIYGVMGIYIAVRMTYIDLDGILRFRGRPLAVFLVVLIALELVTSGVFHTDLGGHFGGLAAGLWFAYLVLPPRHGHGLGALKLARIEPVLCLAPTNGTSPPGRPLWIEPRTVWHERWDRRKLWTLLTGALLFSGLVLYSVFPLFDRSYQLHRVDQLALAGELDPARRRYQELVARSDDPRARLHLAVVARLQRDLAGAWEQLDPLTRIPSDYRGDPPRLLLWALLRSEHFEELSRLARLSGGGPRRRLAELETALADPAPFLTHAALRRRPAWEMRNNLAWLRAMLGVRLEAALADARKSVDERADGANLDTLGWIQAKRGRLDEAARSLERALELDASSAGHFHLAQVLDRQGKSQSAREQYRRALALRGDQQIAFADLLAAQAALR